LRDEFDRPGFSECKGLVMGAAPDGEAVETPLLLLALEVVGMVSGRR